LQSPSPIGGRKQIVERLKLCKIALLFPLSKTPVAPREPDRYTLLIAPQEPKVSMGRPSVDSTASPWFAGGLRFQCTQCGHCCTGEPGYVWLNDEEIEELAEVCGETPARFMEIYTKSVGKRKSLRELPDGACVFYRTNIGCTLYEHRPRQCRTWPFWDSNLESPGAWKEAGQGCPGIDQGPLIAVEEILRQSRVIKI
jgi:Fe-S-cluster containining protein